MIFFDTPCHAPARFIRREALTPIMTVGSGCALTERYRTQKVRAHRDGYTEAPPPAAGDAYETRLPELLDHSSADVSQVFRFPS